MKKLYEKNELIFSIVWIVIYCALQSMAEPLNERIGIEYSASAALCILQAIFLVSFIRRGGLMKKYGLCRPAAPARRFLYYAPLVIFSVGNLWYGAAANASPAGTVCRVVTMLFVGFVEEVIFRGLLFKAMAKDNVKAAVIVSSVSFGIGHIVNLFNGSGMELTDNVCQIAFAVSAGFLFVTIFYRGGSLVPCMIAHSAHNALNTFVNEAGLTAEKQIVSCLILIVVNIAYTFILIRTLPERQEPCPNEES